MNVLEKILEEIEKEQNSYEADHAWNYSKGMEYAKEIIRSHMNEVENDGWILVEERLPEEGTKVIGYENGEMLIGEVYIATDGSVTVDDGAWETLWNVRAWMPVPEPYKPNKQD